MKSPWTTTSVPRPDSEVVVLATVLTLPRKRDGFWLLRASLLVRRALLASPGALAVSLQAHPWRGEYLTLSVWRDDAAVRSFVGSEPHRSVMKHWRGRLSDARFASWTQSAAAPVEWAAVKTRLAPAQRAPGPVTSP